MESNLTVSVAIATYNRAAMLRQAVDAALEQSRAPLEVVVSDDASTDGTAEVLRALASRDERVRVVRQAANSGGVGNWNLAMAKTRGDLIAWCSDDDWFRPGHLEASAAYLEEHPEVGLVHSHFVDMVETPAAKTTEYRRMRSLWPLEIRPGNLFAYLNRYYDWPFHPSTIVMRRAVWEQTGPFDARYQLADTDWFVRAAERFRVAMLPRYGTNNRRHVGNWSNRVGSAGMQREIFEIVESALRRRWPRWTPRRAMWSWLWRTNVRARLLLTLRARVRDGHTEAACAAWSAMVTATGRRMPEWFERGGAALARRWSERNRHSPEAVLGAAALSGRPFGDAGSSVRPL